MSNIALKAVGVLVLFPTTLVAGFFTFLGVPFLIDAIKHPSSTYPYRAFLLAPLLCMGWFGLVTLWRLYHRFNANRPLGNIQLHRAGLASGGLASITLLLSMPGTMLPAWPLIAAIYFMWRLNIAAQPTPSTHASGSSLK